MEIIFLLITLVDGFVVAGIINLIINSVFGNTTIGNLLNMVLSFAGGIGYFFLCWYLNLYAENITIGIFLFVVLAPLVVLLIAKAYTKAHSGTDTSGDNDNSQ